MNSFIKIEFYTNKTTTLFTLHLIVNHQANEYIFLPRNTKTR